MTDELVLNEIVTSWQEHAVAVPSPSLSDIRRRAHVFQKRVRLWNAYHYLMGAVAIVSYIPLVFAHPSLRFGIAVTLIIAGCLFGMFRVHKERSSRSVPADLGSLTFVEFHRTELLRQRAFLLKSWRYLMLPLPGVAVLMFTQRPNSWLATGEFVVIYALMLLGVVMARRRQARKLQTEIESLDAMTQR